MAAELGRLGRSGFPADLCVESLGRFLADFESSDRLLSPRSTEMGTRSSGCASHHFDHSKLDRWRSRHLGSGDARLTGAGDFDDPAGDLSDEFSGEEAIDRLDSETEELAADDELDPKISWTSATAIFGEVKTYSLSLIEPTDGFLLFVLMRDPRKASYFDLL